MDKATEGGLGSGRNGHMPWMKEITELKTNKHKSGLEDMDMSEFANKNHMCKNCMNKAFASLTANESKASEGDDISAYKDQVIEWVKANQRGGGPYDEPPYVTEYHISQQIKVITGIDRSMDPFNESIFGSLVQEGRLVDAEDYFGKSTFGNNMGGAYYAPESKAKEDALPFDPFHEDPELGWQDFNMDVGADGMIKHSHPSAAGNIDTSDRQFHANPEEWNTFSNDFRYNYQPEPVGVSDPDDYFSYTTQVQPASGKTPFDEAEEIGELDEDKEESKIAKALLDELDKELDSESLASEDTSDSSAFFTQNFNLVPTEGAGIAVCKHCGYNLDLEKFDSTVLQEHLRLDHGIAESKASEMGASFDTAPYVEEIETDKYDDYYGDFRIGVKCKLCGESFMDISSGRDTADQAIIGHIFQAHQNEIQADDITTWSPSGVDPSPSGGFVQNVWESKSNEGRVLLEVIDYSRPFGGVMVEDWKGSEEEAEMKQQELESKYGDDYSVKKYDMESKAKEGSWDELGDNPTPEEIENYLRTHPEEVQAIDDMEIDLDKLEF